MSLTPTCEHAGKCKGCKKWYCLNDEMYHCYKCYECLDFCYKCSGVGDPGLWKWLCKSCYYEGETTTKCLECNRYRRITRHEKPFNHSIEEDSICLSCFRRKLNSKKNKVLEESNVN